jgi:hypothetical protein
MSDGPSILLESARTYLARGYAVIPVPARKKIPVLKGWTDLRLAESDLPAHFNGTGNIGVLLGEPSGWLVDVDLDCEEAVALAPKFLPPTGAMSGRPGKPASHWWYVCEGMKTRKHQDPVSKKMIVELRSTGAQTVVGPSIHPSGEPYDPLDGEPAVVDAGELAAAVAALAEAVTEQRHGRKKRSFHSRRHYEAIASSGRRRAPPRRGVPRPHPAGDLRLGRAQPDLRGRDGDGARVRARSRGGVLAAVGSVQPAVRAAVVGEGAAAQGDRRRQQAARPSARLAPRCSEARGGWAAWTCRVHGPSAGEAERAAPLRSVRPIPARSPITCSACPGFIEQVMAYNLATATRPAADARARGAICLQAVLAGRKVRDERGNRTNVYCVGVAPSGAGKDNARKVNKNILFAADWSSTRATRTSRQRRRAGHRRRGRAGDPVPDRRVRALPPHHRRPEEGPAPVQRALGADEALLAAPTRLPGQGLRRRQAEQGRSISRA